MSVTTPMTSTLERADVPATYSLGIDVATRDAAQLFMRLARLKSTIEIEPGSQYRECPLWAQILLTTTKTESEMDAWLYAGKGIDYVGVFTRNPA